MTDTLSRVVYQTRTGQLTAAEHHAVVRRIHGAPMRRPALLCRTRTPEVHEAGEFPMTCYDCQVADQWDD